VAGAADADDAGVLLYDRVQQTAWTAPAHLLRDGEGHGLLVLRKMAELIRGAPVYVLDNIAVHLHERLGAFEDTEAGWRELAPAAHPPSERLWFEWSLAGVAQEPFRGWHRLGVLMRRQGVDELPRHEAVPGSARYFWQPRIAVWRAEESPPLWPPTTHRAFADRDGTVFGVGRIVGPNTFGDYFTCCTLALALLAVALLDTRNVDQEVHNAPGRAAQSGQERPTVYRTLRIKPTRPAQPGAPPLDAQACLRRQLLEGGWRVFPPERPLHGKPGLHGRYWVEPKPHAARRVGT